MLILLQPQSLIIAISITKKSKLHSLSSSSAIWLASKIFYSSSSRKKKQAASRTRERALKAACSVC